MNILTLQPDSSTGKDVLILNGGFANTNYSTDVLLVIGESNSGGGTYRTILKYDLSSIPSNASIISAKLYLTVNSDVSLNQRTITAYRMKRNWVFSEITWNRYSVGNLWETAGATGTNDIDVTGVAAGTQPASPDIHSVITITFTPSEFEKLIDGTYTNYGWLLKVDTEDEDEISYLSSRDTTPSYRPSLIVYYQTSAWVSKVIMF